MSLCGRLIRTELRVLLHCGAECNARVGRRHLGVGGFRSSWNDVIFSKGVAHAQSFCRGFSAGEHLPLLIMSDGPHSVRPFGQWRAVERRLAFFVLSEAKIRVATNSCGLRTVLDSECRVSSRRAGR